MSIDPATLVTLRANIREAEASLHRLAALEEAWGDYADALRRFIRPADGKEGLDLTPTIGVRIQAAELERLRIISMLPTSLPSYSNRALIELTSHNLRTQMTPFLQAICHVETGADGREYVEVGPDGEPDNRISASRFEAMVDECKALFETRRRELRAGLERQKVTAEETERAIAEERQHELAKAREDNSFWLAFKRTFVGKVLVWAFEDPLKKTISGVILATGAVYVVPPLRALVVGVWRRLFQHP